MENQILDAYCMKCRTKREMKNPVEIELKGKKGAKRAMTGFCSVCGTKMFRILGNKKVEQPQKSQEDTQELNSIDQ